MKHVCEKCGEPLDKHTGLCPNCDGDTFVPMEDVVDEYAEKQVTKKGIIAIFVAVMAFLIVVSVIIFAATNGWIGGKEKHTTARSNYEAYFNEKLYPKFGMLDFKHPGVDGKGIFFGDMFDLNNDKSEELVVAHSEHSGDNIDYKLSAYEYNPNAALQGGSTSTENNHGVELNSTVTVFSEPDFEQLSSSHEQSQFEFYLVENKDKSYIIAERVYEANNLNYECHVFTLLTGNFAEVSNLYIMKNAKGETAVISTKFPSTLGSDEYQTSKLKGFDELPENSGVIFFEGEKKTFDSNYKTAQDAVNAFFNNYFEKKEDSPITNDGFKLSEVDKDAYIFTYSYTLKANSKTGETEDNYEVEDYTTVTNMLNSQNRKSYDNMVKKNEALVKKAKETKSDVVFGDVVKKDDYLYYWRYQGDTYSRTSSESGNYRYNSDADNELIKRDKNGKETVILESAGVGKLAVVENRIFYQKANGNSDSYNVDSCDLDGEDVTYHATGVIVGVVQNGAYVVYAPSTDKEEFGTIGAVKTESLEKVTTAYNARFITCDDDRIYFQSEQAEYTESHHGKTTLSSVNANGSGSRNLYVTDDDMYEKDSSYENTVTMILDNCIQNGYIYYSYGSYDKESDDFKGGKIAKVKLDGSGGEIIGTTSSESFTIDSKGNLVNKNDGSSMSGYTVKDGSVYKYNSSNSKLEEIINENDYANFTSSKLVDKAPSAIDDLVQLDSVNKIDNKLYFRIKIGEEYSSDESGKSYRYKGSALFEKDLNSGNTKEIYSVLYSDKTENDSYDDEEDE